MTPTHLWHGAVGLALVGVGVAIIGGVAYLLYTPDVPFIGDSRKETVFSCPGVTFTAFVSDDTVHLSFSDGREFDAVRNPPASEVPPEEEWKRYASSDGALVFWYAGERALIEGNGTVLYGECVAQ